jgi:hypothetical protein
MNQVHQVDHSALKVNQAIIITLLIIAFVINGVWLVALVAGIMWLGTLRRQPGFKIIYTGLLKPLGIIKPELIQDNPQPHLFAQGMGGTVLLIAVLAFALGNAIIGWALTWLVVALAALNLLVGFCAGCFVYYWLARLRIPGFVAQPLPGTFPGMRPKGRTS